MSDTNIIDTFYHWGLLTRERKSVCKNTKKYSFVGVLACFTLSGLYWGFHIKSLVGERQKVHNFLLLVSSGQKLIFSPVLPGESAAPPKHVKPLQRCPTLNNSKTNSDQKANGSTPSSTSTNNGNAVKAEPPAQGPGGTPKRKESVSWSPFGAIGKAVSSGVNIVGDATKAVGTGVVQGTKVSKLSSRQIPFWAGAMKD